MSTQGSRYRSRSAASQVVALSVSYHREHLLARGWGLEHLKELVLRIARPLLRRGASLAYGGHWKDTKDNFTFELLRLISAEQEDNSLGGPDTDLTIGRLYNYLPWPNYLDVTPRIEAEWVNCCRIVRFTQEQAGIAPNDIVADQEAASGSERAVLNAAIVLSGMRRLAVKGLAITLPGLPTSETIPPISARVLLGGKVDGYSGFLPGLFEEALVSLESQSPLYILGGFGGAAEVLANALTTPGAPRPKELTIQWQQASNPNLAALGALANKFSLPGETRTSAAALDQLWALIDAGRANPEICLNVGLDRSDTLELLRSRDMGAAVNLVRKGLDAKMGKIVLPA